VFKPEVVPNQGESGRSGCDRPSVEDLEPACQMSSRFR
jgi:hypothetical protein